MLPPLSYFVLVNPKPGRGSFHFPAFDMSRTPLAIFAPTPAPGYGETRVAVSCRVLWRVAARVDLNVVLSGYIDSGLLSLCATYKLNSQMKNMYCPVCIVSLDSLNAG